MQTNHKAEFMSVFRSIARNKNRYEVWRDFVSMAGISYQNVILKDPDIEQSYLDIAGRYSKEDINQFPKLLAHVTMALEQKPQDFLGQVFMELEISSKEMGQFFTPYEICLLMSKLNIGSIHDLEYEESHPFITLSEPASGAGGMVIAFVETMLEAGYNPQQKLWCECWDLDLVAVMMCYIQLSLLHIPAKVVHGNTLSQERYGEYYTPAHYLGNWSYKTRKHWDQKKEPSCSEIEQEAKALLEMPVSELDDSNNVVQEDAEISPVPDVVLPEPDKNGQFSLFDLD